jgi:hypothetical protein
MRNPNGSFTLSFRGTVGSTNIVQSASRLVPPIDWQNVSTNIADANGLWQLTESSSTNPTRFYRSYAR